MTLCAVTITLNAERHIEGFIKSHNFADQVLVVDSGSTDETVKKAIDLGARVLHRDWEGYAQQWNWAFEQCSSDWILYGDADHIVPAVLADEVSEAIEGNQASAFLIPRLTMYRGRPLRHGGWYPDLKVRLLKNGSGAFDTSRSVHERLLVNGPIAPLQNPILHDSFAGFSEAIEKLDRYSSLEAVDRADRSLAMTFKQWDGRSLRSFVADFRHVIPLGSVAHFVYRYFIRAGFLDGREGLEMAFIAGSYEFAVRSKIRDLRRDNVRGEAGQQE